MSVPGRFARPFGAFALGALVLLLGLQLVPYGPATQPATRMEPQWDSPRTRELAVRSCFDCHSNETIWPWYSHIAPISWLVRRDVDRGRAELNFSEWGLRRQEGNDAAESVADGKMPLALYTLVQRQAILTPAERAELIAGLTRTLGGGGRGEEHD